MPRSSIGQLITFAIETDSESRLSSWITIPVKKGQTIAKIAAQRGHPEDARAIATKNGLRSVNSVFTGRGIKQIKVPSDLKDSFNFDVLAGDDPPQPTAGYAKLAVVDRPQRVGLSTFTGYDPFQMRVPILFLAKNATGGEDKGMEVMRDIDLLERMAGRGNWPGAGVGPPPLIHISTTGPQGEVVPLIPRNFQWSEQNKSAPVWRIEDIQWGSKPRRNTSGNITRQSAVVIVRQFVIAHLINRSTSVRVTSR